MPKTILELPCMPKHCMDCVLSSKKPDKWICTAFNMIIEVDIDARQRPEFCPLKEVEEDA